MPYRNDLKGWHKLPFELRLEILEFVLAPPEPPTPSTAQEGRIMRYDYTWGGQGLWEVPLTSPTGNLLLVSKQFHKDVKHIIDLLPNIYHVDIMVVKDHGLWPTWHCLKPPSSDVIEEVTATFRIFEPTDDLDTRFKGPLSFRPGDGGPIPAVWAFHQLFLNLTSYGPGLTPEKLPDRSTGPPKYVVKRITMNILSPADGVVHTKPKSCNYHRSRGIARVLARADGGNLAVALLARNADNLNNLRDGLRKETNGLLHAFPTDTQPENLRKAFQDIRNHDDFKGLKLKLAIYHVKHASKKPLLEETAEAFTDSMQMYTTGAVVFAQEALKLIYEQNGGQTLLSDTNGVKKGTIIFTGTLGAIRTNTGYAAYGATRASARMVAQAIAKEHSKYGVQCVHAIANGRITDEDTEETRTGKHMRAEDVGQTYLWLSQQPSSLWVHELDLRPAQESF